MSYLTNYDVKYFYLNTPMSRYSFMRLKLSNLPEDFVQQCDVTFKVSKDGYVHIKFRHRIYGLP